MPDRSGKVLDHYFLLRLLGQGRFGEVYLAEDKNDNNARVAVKVLRTNLDQNNVREFVNEARAFRLKHPNIMSIKDFGVEKDLSFLVMDYTPNGNLRQRHVVGIPLPPEIIVSYVKQIAAALQCVHDNNLVHRDVKPENMLVGKNNEILLSDFGIATPSYSWNPANPQEPFGTLVYMAPEQIGAKAVRASDQYSLGAITYEWLTGTPPFLGTMQEVVVKHLKVSPPSLRAKVPGISPELEQVVLRALRKDPAQRFTSVSAFALALEKTCQPQKGTTVYILKGHSDGIRAVAWSPNGKYIASASSDETARIWDVRTSGALQTYKNHSGELWSIAWSPHSTQVATGGDDGTVRVWEAASGASVSTYTGHEGRVRAVAWSPHVRYIASGSEDKTAQVWDVMGTQICVFTAHTDSVCAVSWSPDSKYVASGGNDRKIYVWEVKTGRHLYSCNGHSHSITAIKWSPNGQYIASTGDDKTIRLWEAATGSLFYTFQGHTDAIEDIAWSFDGTRIASGSWDQTVRIWNVTSGKVIYTYNKHSNWVTSVAWSPDDRYIVSGSLDDTTHVWFAPL